MQEKEREIESNAARYAQEHPDGHPRGRLISAVRGAVRRVRAVMGGRG